MHPPVSIELSAVKNPVSAELSAVTKPVSVELSAVKKPVLVELSAVAGWELKKEEKIRHMFPCLETFSYLCPPERYANEYDETIQVAAGCR